MTSNLKVIQEEPNSVLVEQLERLVTDAKTGELQGMAYVVMWRGGTVSHGWNIQNNRMRIIGELEQVKWHLLSQDK